MSETVKHIISYVFKRSGKPVLSESEFYLTVSMHMKWCPPNIAKEFVSSCISLGLLKQEGETVSPGFDVDGVAIPLGFHPTGEDFLIKNKENIEKSQERNVFDVVLDRLQAKTLLDRGGIEKEVSTLIDKKDIYRGSALALFARIHSVDINELIPLLKEEMLRESIE